MGDPHGTNTAGNRLPSEYVRKHLIWSHVFVVHCDRLCCGCHFVVNLAVHVSGAFSTRIQRVVFVIYRGMFPRSACTLPNADEGNDDMRPLAAAWPEKRLAVGQLRLKRAASYQPQVILASNTSTQYTHHARLVSGTCQLQRVSKAMRGRSSKHRCCAR